MTPAEAETSAAEAAANLEVVIDNALASGGGPHNNDGNNNEANDSNNNVGSATTMITTTTPTTSSSETTLSVSTVARPPALPPRPPNLVLPHAGAVPRPPQIPYTIMQQGKRVEVPCICHFRHPNQRS